MAGGNVRDRIPGSDICQRVFQQLQTICTGFRCEHQHQIIRIGKFALDVRFSQKISQFRAGIAVTLCVNGQLRGLITQKSIVVICQLCFAVFHRADRCRKPLPVTIS